MFEYFVYMYVCVPYACLVPVVARRGYWIPGTGVPDCKDPCGYWKLNADLLKEKQELILATKSSLYALKRIFYSPFHISSHLGTRWQASSFS